VLVIQPEGAMHYGKLVCHACSKFVTWARQPRTDSRHAEYQEKVDFLKGQDIGAYEMSFLTKLEAVLVTMRAGDRYDLTPIQSHHLELLYKYHHLLFSQSPIRRSA